MKHQVIYTGCTLASMVKGVEDYGLVKDACIVVQDGHVAWVGQSRDLPESYRELEGEDLGQRLVTPALIDCHTHLVFAGSRAREFEMRLKGTSYAEIARAGGGIMSTVNSTRAASEQELIEESLRRLDNLIREGVGVVEVKSGYGLSIEHELRLLRVARHLGTLRPVRVITTWLAAHAIPPEYAGRADEYIDEVAIPGLKLAVEQGLVDAVDGFCEEIAFTRQQIERLFRAAQSQGVPVKLHAEQLSDQKGAVMAAKYGALSVDHLEYLAPEDVDVLAVNDVAAVLLPGAYYTLKEIKLPPIESFRQHGIEMAVATDCNPGSSPISSILTAMNMACTQFSLTPEEVLAGVTRCAAKALGLSGLYGVIAPAAVAEFAVWDVEHPAELSYWVGGDPLYKRISQGADA